MWNDDYPERVDQPPGAVTPSAEVQPEDQEDLADQGDLAAARRLPGFLRLLLLWTPIAACLACMALAFLALPAEEEPIIPVTGGSLPAAPTLTPRAPAEPQPTAAVPPHFSFSYKVEAMRRLSDCTMAFQDFFMIEQVAIHEPQLIRNQAWRDQAAGAMLAFEEGCSTLGSLPPAPSAYGEADTWLKLAAGEVDSAANRFDVMLVENDTELVMEIAGHMLRFMEFTHNAERIIEHLEERKEL